MIANLNIPTSVPLVYELDDDLRPIKHAQARQLLQRESYRYSEGERGSGSRKGGNGDGKSGFVKRQRDK